ncbi:hypothetical protein ACGFMM_11905 [Streptomyces sp. NPDC048604]|uniref:hypothetical protein n=1 Tax=Streptomyces sp. NPDC048604 TaxID=3365578 RepID=UPI003714CFB1
MTTSGTSRFVRLRVDLVLEVGDAEALTAAALERIAVDELMPPTERSFAEDAVREDESEALAYLVDPVELLGGVPGVELAHASWSTEPVEYDPDSLEWDLDEDDVAEEDDEDEDPVVRA